MSVVTVKELREKYLRFFESKGSLIHDSGSLIPFDVTGRLDESLLFNGAGMVQFKPYFRGIATPPNKRLTTAQKCVRTGDIDEVGDDSHLTFFEMLGNFSFGDYFKQEAIDYSWEFLTSPEWLGLDPKKLSFTVFEEDDEAFGYWAAHLEKAGIDPATRVFRLGEETNYWPAGAFSKGPPGPCGPNSEMFYWQGAGDPPTGPYTVEDWLRDDDAKNWLEIWNDVFIQYEWQGTEGEGECGWVKTGMPNLPFNGIDTGMGIERTVAVLNGYKSVYETDAFAAIFAKLDELAVASGSSTTNPHHVGKGEGRTAQSNFGSHAESPTPTPPPLEKGEGLLDTPPPSSPEGGGGQGVGDSATAAVTAARRIIADHIRTACFCIADGILPANNGRGYVLRRLIRRAVLKGQRTLGFEDVFLFKVASAVFETFGDHYKELLERREIIEETLKNEEELFRQTLNRGTELLFDSLCMVIVRILNNMIQFREAQDLFDPEIKRIQKSLPDDLDSLSLNQLNALKLDIRDFLHNNSELNKSSLLTEIFALRKNLTDAYQSIATDKKEQDFWKKRVKQDIELQGLPGDTAFKLYDTFGFPLEVTQELCAEAGITVDLEGYKKALAEAQERSRGAQGEKSAYGDLQAADELKSANATETSEFLGYSAVAASGHVRRIRPLGNGKALVALDRTPFYAESGGQTGDTGEIRVGATSLIVANTTKSAGLFWHEVIGSGVENLLDQEAEAIVDGARRSRIKRHHTATHLLQAALRQVLGTHVTQAGSFNGPENLRFDFTHGKAMTTDEIAEVERIVNDEILKNTDVTTYVDLPIDEARAKGAMALFGEKYGDKVRMVEIGEFSKELCGGTHVRTTGEIGLFKIVSEASAASGVRRIEAITGETAYAYVLDQQAAIREAANLLKSNPKELVQAVEKTLTQLKEERQKREKAEMAAMSGGASTSNTVEVNGVTLWVKNFGDVDQKVASQAIDNEANGKPSQVTLGAVVGEKITFMCKVGTDAQAKGAHAGNLLREIAKIAGGGGGGQAAFATAGGRDASKVDEALGKAEEFLRSQLK